jgi:hypothetical protein
VRDRRRNRPHAFTGSMILGVGPDMILRWPIAGLAAQLLAGACASSVIIVEVLRVVFGRTPHTE